MTPEGKVKKECRAYLKSIGAYHFSPVPMGYGQGGVDDFVCYCGAFIAIEFKRGDGVKSEPTKLQEKCLRDVQTAGGFSWVVRSLGELKNLVESITSNHQLRRLHKPDCDCLICEHALL